jgi:hypothetical protein
MKGGTTLMDTIAIELTRDEYDVLIDALRIATEHGEDETHQRLRQKMLEAWLAANIFDLVDA